MSRYKFTQPKNSKRTADYVNYMKTIKQMELGYSTRLVSCYKMTFQALCEADLAKTERSVKNNRKVFKLTERGEEYLRYVNSIEKVDKNKIMQILHKNYN